MTMYLGHEHPRRFWICSECDAAIRKLQMNPRLHNVADLERIAELEAELARVWEKVRLAENQARGLEAGIHWWKEKLSKAEAEVERLTADLATATKALAAAEPAARKEAKG